MYYKGYALLAILIASGVVVGSNAYAASAPTVQTDKTSYQSGDTIVVSGKVTPVAGQALLIEVFNPSNALYRADTIVPAADGSYNYNLKIGGKLGPTGTYTVVVTYNQQKAQTTFSFTNNILTGGSGGWQTYNGQGFTVQYMITGGTLNNITADTTFTSLKAYITSTSSGTLQLKIPRTVLDAKTDTGADDDFVVFADDVPTSDVNQTATASDRTVSINFDQGTQTIEVVGTVIHVVPEFGAGAVAAIVLAIAIVAVVVTTSRHNRGLTFLPK
jgi:hypothetical protein